MNQMLELTNLRSSNIKSANQVACENVSLDRACKIKGSGFFSGAGALAGGFTGAGVGIIQYPVQEGYQKS